MSVRGLLEPRSTASGRFLVLRKDQCKVFGKLRSATVKGRCGAEEPDLWGLGHVDYGVWGPPTLVYCNGFRPIVLDKWCDLREHYKYRTDCKRMISVLRVEI